MIDNGYVLVAVWTIFSASLLITLIRFLLGPTHCDRVVAIDLFAAVLMVGFVILGIQYNQEVYLSAALAIAVISFLATIAVSKYLEKKDEDLHD